MVDTARMFKDPLPLTALFVGSAVLLFAGGLSGKTPP